MNQTYLHPPITVRGVAEAAPTAPPPGGSAAPTSDRPPAGNRCETCHLPAGMLRRIDAGPWQCDGCRERSERAARESSPEAKAAEAALAAEMARIEEYRRIDALRPPPAEHDCEVNRHHGRAEFLRGGLLLCRSCAERTLAPIGEPYQPPFPPAPVITLESRLVELTARVERLEAAHAEPAPAARSSRKVAQ